MNLSFGLVSLSALDNSREWFLFFWATTAGIALLLASMLTHLTLGLVALYQRNTLRMTISSLIQLVLGFVYPLVVGIPLLALLGMVEAGKEVIERY
jgi:adenylate cyclase